MKTNKEVYEKHKKPPKKTNDFDAASNEQSGKNENNCVTEGSSIAMSGHSEYPKQPCTKNALNQSEVLLFVLKQIKNSPLININFKGNFKELDDKVRHFSSSFLKHCSSK